MTSQYETNLWSTHVNIVRLAEPIRRCVRWRTQVFKIEGFVCKRFLPSPPPPPSFIFWLSFHFSRGQNRSFFAPKPNGNACYAGYRLAKISSKQFALFYVRIVKGTKSNTLTCKLCAWAIFIILFTELLCDKSNSFTYEPRKGQSPILSRANCMTVYLMQSSFSQ